MIAAVAVCPHPPLLFRELAGHRDVAAELRAACVRAVSLATGAGVERVVVIGGAEATGSWDPTLLVDVRAFGTTGARPNGPSLPLSLGVARRLLDQAGWRGPVEMHTVAWDAPAAEVRALADKLTARDEPVALLVLGEGSTRRGEKAPGYLDERAFAFDEATGRALATGATEALAATDAGLAEELMVSGRAPFAVLANAVRAEGATPRAELVYQDDPWGVMYYVATWRLG
ncbi:MAG TPA: hypothetical protein VFG63_11395 [Nocardioidaceae bacterium]|nr:hypothetical protein [Nocardioidaceae bacterium]